MKISLKELGNIAGRFLDVLNRENIHSTETLEENLDARYNYSDQSQDYVDITLRPSKGGTLAYTVSYTRPGTGIPLEIKVNPSLRYSQIILKAEVQVEGYSPYIMDNFDNFVQAKVIPSAEFEISKEELEKLTTS